MICPIIRGAIFFYNGSMILGEWVSNVCSTPLKNNMETKHCNFGVRLIAGSLMNKVTIFFPRLELTAANI